MPARRLNPDLLRQLLEESPDGMSIIDGKLRYRYLNPAAEQLFGRSRRELLDSDALVNFPPSAHDEVRRSIAHVLRGEPQRLTGVIVRPDGEERAVDTLRMPLNSDGEPLVASIFRDVTELRRREREASAIAGTAATVASMGSLQSTLDTLAAAIVGATRGVAAIVLSADPEVRRGFRAAGTAGLHPEYMSRMEEAVRGGATAPSMEFLARNEPLVVEDLRGTLLSDSAFAPVHPIIECAAWATAIYLPLVFGGERVGTAITLYPPGMDWRAEEAFLHTIANQAAIAVGNARLLAEAQARAAAEERQHLARELHDSVSQALYAIGLGARTARSLIDSDPGRAAEAVDYVLSLAEAGLTEMRALIFELRPEALEHEGLVAALRKQLDVARARHGLEVDDQLGGEPALATDAQAALYRIGQEAIHNVIRHARASRVCVRLSEGRDRVALEVVDDGVGFDPEQVPTGHLGLTSMRERAAAQGGEVTVTSQPHAGSRVVATFPAGAARLR